MPNHSQNSLPVSSDSSTTPSQFTTPASDFYYEMEKGYSLRDYIDILLRRKWWVIGTFLTIVFLVGLYTFTRTPVYRSVATLEITNDNPGSQLDVSGAVMGSSWFFAQNFQQTQYKILESRSIALRVIKALNLEEHPDYAFLKGDGKKMGKAELEEAMVKLFLSRLQIEPIRNTLLVDVSYQSTDKELVKKVLDIIADEYMFLLIDRRNESFKLVRNWLNKQLDEWANKVQEAQNKLYKFGQDTDIYMIENNDPRYPGQGQSQNVIVQKFNDLSALLTKAQAEEMEKQGQYQQIKEQGPDAPLIVNHPLISALRQEMVVQQAKVSGLNRVYLDGHPEMQAEKAKLVELRTRLNAEVKRLQESVKADYEAAKRTEKLLQESFAAQKQRMADLQDNLSNYQILKRDALTNEQLYQALLARVKEANISSTMVASNVSVIDPAPLPTMPFAPKTVRNLALAMLLGLVFGTGLAFLVESLDDTIRSTEDLQKSSHLPVMGTLPALSSFRKMTRNLGGKRSFSVQRLLPGFLRRQPNNLADADLDLVVFQNPSDPMTEAIRQMQTSIMLSVSGSPPAAIMVTSPNPSEGKSMVANNLALGFAMNGRSTVIMDCDLRKPRIHKVYGLDPLPGLTNYLTGTAGPEEIQRDTDIPNLSVIPAGPISPSPGNLLSSQLFKELLVKLRQQYNHIIIDTPPVLAFSDARIVSVLADGTLLVTKYQHTHKSAARMAVQLLAQINAPIMGGILNDIQIYSGNYGGYHYHNYKNYFEYYSQKD
jgi:polysaccharide biosynthesis transport protein